MSLEQNVIYTTTSENSYGLFASNDKPHGTLINPCASVTGQYSYVCNSIPYGNAL